MVRCCGASGDFFRTDCPDLIERINNKLIGIAKQLLAKTKYGVDVTIDYSDFEKWKAVKANIIAENYSKEDLEVIKTKLWD